jgi:hypothetical protein
MRFGQAIMSIHGAAGGDGPELLDAVAADGEVPVVEVDGRVAMAGRTRILSPMRRRLVAPEMPRRPYSSAARS